MIDVHECEKYGYSRLQRIKELEEKSKKAKEVYSLEFMGKYNQYPVVEVRIEFPVYRLRNGRTRTLQLEYLAKHPDQKKDLFTSDHDALEAQLAQNELLDRLVKDENLLQEFSESTQQTEPIIVTYDGVVVNGNRRLCAWRKLYYSNSTKYKHFQTIRALVLPQADEKALDDLEEALQTAKTFKANYSWHAIARRGKDKLEKNPGTEAELAEPLGLKNAGELKLLIEAYNYADQYLESRNKKDYWSEMDGYRYAFEAIAKTRKKIDSQEKKELFEQLAFQTIERGSDSGRLYTVIQDIGDNIDRVFVELKKNLPQNEKVDKSEEPVTDKDTGELSKWEMSSDESKEIQDDSDLLTDDNEFSENGGREGSEVIDVINRIKDANDVSAVQEITKNAVDTAKQLKKDKDAADYLFKQICKAEQIIQGAIDNGMNSEEVSIEGLDIHLKKIIEKINIIQEWLNYK